MSKKKSDILESLKFFEIWILHPRIQLEWLCFERICLDLAICICYAGGISCHFTSNSSTHPCRKTVSPYQVKNFLQIQKPLFFRGLLLSTCLLFSKEEAGKDQTLWFRVLRSWLWSRLATFTSQTELKSIAFTENRSYVGKERLQPLRFWPKDRNATPQ